MPLRVLSGLGLVLSGVMAFVPEVLAQQPSSGLRIIPSQPPLFEDGEHFDNQEEYLGAISRDSAVFAVAWSPDGETLAIGTEDGAVHIWEISGSRERVRIEVSPPVESLAFSPDGRRLAVASKNSGVSVWDPTTGKPTLLQVPGNVTAVSYSPDNRLLACGFAEGHIDFWNLEDGTQARRLEGHADRVNSIAWNPDGNAFASGSWDGTVRLWSPETGEEIRSLRGHDSLVYSVSWNGDGDRLASGASDGSVRVWNVATGEETTRLEGHTQGVTSVAWSDDGNTVASGSLDHTLRLWDLRSRTEALEIDRHQGRVTALVVRDGILASGSADGTVRLWDLGTAEDVDRFEGHASEITAVTWSRDVKTLAVVHENRDIVFWNLQTNTETARVEGLHTAAITAAALHPDGTRLAVGFEDGIFSIWPTARLLDAGGLRQPVIFSKHQGQRVSALAWNHDGSILASGDWGGRLFFWIVEKDSPQSGSDNELVGQRDDILALAWSGDGALASASKDGSLQIWSFLDGAVQEGQRVEGETKEISALSWVPGGMTLVMGLSTGSIRYWDLDSGTQRPAQRFTGESPYVVGISSDGRVLASSNRGAGKGLLRMWIRSDSESGYRPSHKILSGKRGTWVVCQSNKNCLRNDDGTLVLPFPLQTERTKIELLSMPDEITTEDGMSSSFNLQIRNMGSALFWVDVRRVDKDNDTNNLVFYPPPTKVEVAPGEKVDLQCRVAVSSSYDDPQGRSLPLWLEVTSSNADPLVLDAIQIRSRVPSLEWRGAQWSQDGDGNTHLRVNVVNVGAQSLVSSRFTANIIDLEQELQAAVPRPIQPNETTQLQFEIPQDIAFQAESVETVSIIGRKPDYPIHQWSFVDQKIEIFYPLWAKALIGGLLTLIVFLLYRFRFYLDTTVRQVMKSPEMLLHPQKLVHINKILAKWQKGRILSSEGIRRDQLDHAVDFFTQQDPSIRSLILSERLIQETDFIKQLDETLWLVPLGSEFLLNIEDFLIYLPEDKRSPNEEWERLLKYPVTYDKVTLLISTDLAHQNRYHALAEDTANLVIAPCTTQIMDLFMRPSPLDLLTELIASQILLSRISPYQIGAGVNKDAIFFGRQDVISKIKNRAPFNYFIVGGRQVGKSSLLKALLRRMNDQEDVICYYFVLSDSKLQKRLAYAVGLEETSLDKTLNYLSKLGKEKRRLMLIDEADEFIAEDRRNRFALLSRLRSLSEEGSCYFILAGFWELYDAVVLDYHSPLKNFGETVIVGALEEDACRDLATVPIEKMGIHYESPGLVDRIIDQTGRRANLISTVCHEILSELQHGERIIKDSDVTRALRSFSMYKTMGGWSSSAKEQNDRVEERRVDRVLVYSTIGMEFFSQNDILNLFDKIGYDVDPERVERSLHRLVLAFVLRKDHALYTYQVPLFRTMILEQDPENLLRHELRAHKKGSQHSNDAGE